MIGRVVIVALTIVFVLSSFSTAFSEPGIDETRQSYGMNCLRVAVPDDMKTLNPLVAGDYWTDIFLQWIYESPIKMNDTGHLIPYIAVGSANQTTKSDESNYIWNEDLAVGNFGYTPRGQFNETRAPAGEVTIFYDFTNVKWHDGVQMTIRDVLFSYHVRAQLPSWGMETSLDCLVDFDFAYNHFLHIYKTYESHDSLNAALTFRIQTPYIGFIEKTLDVMLLPYHIWGSKTSGQTYNDTLIWLDNGYTPDHYRAWDSSAATLWDNPEPVGSGPFLFDSWQKGVTSKIITFREYFYDETYPYNGVNLETGKNYAGQPHIDGMVFKIYKTAESAVLALKYDEIDYSAWSLPPTYVQEVLKWENINIVPSSEHGFFYLGYNLRIPSFGYNDAGVDVGKPLRRAISYCIDKDIIIHRILQNFAVAGTCPVNPLSEWYNDSVPTYPFNPNRAIKILRDAGYKLTDPASEPGPGNWWLNPDGTPIGGDDGIIEIQTPPANYDPIRAQAGLMIVSQMQNIGINAESISLDFGTIVERIDARAFEISILGWRVVSDPSDFFPSFFPENNYWGYQNKSFFDLIGGYRELPYYTNAEVVDEIELRNIKEAQAALAYDLPIDVLYFRTNIQAMNTRFYGWINDKGTVFNHKSIFNIQLRSENRLNAQFVNLQSSMKSNDTIEVSVLANVKMKNDDGTYSRTPKENVQVQVDANEGTLSETSGYTDSIGKFKTSYTAPYVEPSAYNLENGMGVLMEIEKAELEGFSDDVVGVTSLITVYPEGVDFLVSKISISPDVIDDVDADGDAGFATIEVLVTDQDNVPVDNCTLTWDLENNSLISSINGQSDSDGKATFTFTAPNLDYATEYRLDLVAKKSGYKDGSQICYIMVMNYVPSDKVIEENSFDYGIAVIGAVAAVGIVATGAAILKFKKP